MKCSYCGKNLKGDNVSIYVSGEKTGSFCDSYCMGELFKKMTLLIKKMSRKELLKHSGKKITSKGTTNEKAQ
jgi:hypothetical protein